MFFYSPSMQGFYLPWHGKFIPKDVIEVSNDRYKELMSEQQTGKVIVFEKGKLISKPVIDTLTDQQKMEAFKKSAAQKLAETDWSQFPDVEDTLFNKDAFVEYRAKLRQIITSSIIDNDNFTFPEKPKAKWRRSDA